MEMIKHVKCLLFTITAVLVSYFSITILAPVLSSAPKIPWLQQLTYGILFYLFGISIPCCIFWIGLMLAYHDDGGD
jgi:chromate transport protein ChrA